MCGQLLWHCGDEPDDADTSAWRERWVRAANSDGETALHLAARHGHAAACTQLLEAGGGLHPDVDRLGGTVNLSPLLPCLVCLLESRLEQRLRFPVRVK